MNTCRKNVPHEIYMLLELSTNAFDSAYFRKKEKRTKKEKKKRRERGKKKKKKKKKSMWALGRFVDLFFLFLLLLLFLHLSPYLLIARTTKKLTINIGYLQ
jgi:cytoskeletal protein RodZ